MTMFVVILAGLALAAPVHCYQTQTAWQATGMATALAYYDSNTHTIALSPQTCKDVRRPTSWGAFVLAHELAHEWQDRQGRWFDEAEADRIAAITAGPLLRRLANFYGRKPLMAPSPDRPVLLAP